MKVAKHTQLISSIFLFLGIFFLLSCITTVLSREIFPLNNFIVGLILFGLGYILSLKKINEFTFSKLLPPIYVVIFAIILFFFILTRIFLFNLPGGILIFGDESAFIDSIQNQLNSIDVLSQDEKNTFIEIALRERKFQAYGELASALFFAFISFKSLNYFKTENSIF